MKRTLAVLLLLLASSARAEFISGNTLYADMLSRDPVRFATAQGYVMGVFDAYQHTQHCAPETVNLRQAWDLAQRMLEAAATIRHDPADRLLVAVFKEAWPCVSRPSRGGAGV